MILNKKLQTDFTDETIINLYHLNLFKNVEYLKSNFSEIKVLCMGGKPSRMKSLAKELRKKCGEESEEELTDFSGAGGRYSMFKTNKVIFLSHGMGIPSITIALDEVTKMLFYAGAKDVIYIRVGTCGGLGLKPGTIVLTEKCYSPKLKDELELFVCGRLIQRQAIIEEDIVESFLKLAKMSVYNNKIVHGNTLCANFFYEEQARMDGCACDISEQEKMDFFYKLMKEFNIKNIEMESLGFAAFCHNLGIKGLVVAVTLVDRLVSEHITISHDEIEEFQSNLNEIVLDYVMTRIKLNLL